MGGDDCDLIGYYATHFRGGMVDLSSSNAETPVLGIDVPLDPGGYGQADAGALQAAIADRYEHVEPGDVVLGCGASEVLAAVAHALVRPGDVIACAQGTYPAFTAAADRCGGRRVRPGTRSDTSVIAICNPTVPHGDILDLPPVIEEARRTGATLVVDEVYRDLVDGEPARAACDLDPAVVSISDFSKPVGLGGLRVGWAIVRDGTLRARVTREIGLLSGGLAVLSVRSALPVMVQFDRLVARTMAAVRENREAVFAVLAEAGWTFRPPAAGLTMIARPPYTLCERDLAALRDMGLFLLPGAVLGEPGGVRVNLRVDPAQLARAVRALEALAGLPEPAASRS